MASGEHSRASGEVPDAGVGRVVRNGGETFVVMPDGFRLDHALYRVCREGRRLILDPVEEGPRAGAVSERLDFEGGRWIVAGTLMPAAALLEMLGHGASPEQVVALCPYLEPADVRACLALGAELTARPVGGSLARVHEGSS